MDNKFTHKEFIERHVEFLKNYNTKYKFQDLDFKMVMHMSGCSDSEFKEHMNKMWDALAANPNKSDEDSHTTQDWGDGEDDDSNDSSRGRANDVGGDDANEY